MTRRPSLGAQLVGLAVLAALPGSVLAVLLLARDGAGRDLVVSSALALATLIAAAVLFYFGTGPIRGFAVTLSIGVMSAVFCNVVVTRAILQMMLARKRSLAL